MISLNTRVYVRHRGLFGRVIKRTPVQNGGMMYTLQVETHDGSNVVAMYGSRDVSIALVQDRPAHVVPVWGPRLVVDNTVQA